MMKKALLLAAVACVALATVPALADTASGSDNKIVAAGKAVGRGIMWGPKQVAKGLKAVGKKVTGK
jgi:hypothetical protein